MFTGLREPLCRGPGIQYRLRGRLYVLRRSSGPDVVEEKPKTEEIVCESRTILSPREDSYNLYTSVN